MKKELEILDLLDIDSIILKASPKDKSEAINEAIELLYKKGIVENIDDFKKVVFQREALGSTGVGEGIAIPHGKSQGVKKAAIVAMSIPQGVEFDSIDGELVTLLFLIAVPEDKEKMHLDILAKLSTLLMNADFVCQLKAATSAEEVRQLMQKADDSGEEEKSDFTQPINILAVTACPTGIAHTYMAAENLVKVGKELGCLIKVETRGAVGVKNELTDSDIANAKGIIIASDIQVPMERFQGKQVIECRVAEGISKASFLIDEIKNDNGKIYIAEKATTGNNLYHQNKGKSIVQIAYMHLMSGVSYMLPFVVGGGILIAMAFLIDGLVLDINELPETMRRQFGEITPMAAFFSYIGNLAFLLMLPVLAGFIALSIGEKPALVVGFIGGMMASQGESGFLGAIVAGFLAGYIMKGLKYIGDKSPQIAEKIATIILYPVLGIIMIGLAMTFMIEPIMGNINEVMSQTLLKMNGGSKILLGMVLGGMMAIDMGGPFNKAAYVFAAAHIPLGNDEMMASVMIGGMVPPCVIALSTMISRRKYTLAERNTGIMSGIMGLAFITEGAIPYVAADPLRVLPTCIISSALAGGLSMFFQCSLMAPHGGIFVFPLTQNAGLYLLALCISTIVGAILLGILKKDISNE